MSDHHSLDLIGFEVDIVEKVFQFGRKVWQMGVKPGVGVEDLYGRFQGQVEVPFECQQCPISPLENLRPANRLKKLCFV